MLKPSDGQCGRGIVQVDATQQSTEEIARLVKDELMRYYAHCHVGLTQHIKGVTQ